MNWEETVLELAKKKKIINLLISQCIRISEETGVPFDLLPETLGASYVPSNANPVEDAGGDFMVLSDENCAIYLDDPGLRGWVK